MDVLFFGILVSKNFLIINRIIILRILVFVFFVNWVVILINIGFIIVVNLLNIL